MKILTAKDVCNTLNIPYWRLEYLFKAGKVSEVQRTSTNQRVFTKKDLAQIKDVLEEIVKTNNE